MRNNFTSDDHDPGDEDPTERVKRALLEVLEDDYRVAPGGELRDGLAIGRGTVLPLGLSQTRATPLLDVPFASSPWPWLV